MLDQVARGQKRVIVEKSGVPVAAIISPSDLERLSVLEAERAARFAVLDRIRAKNADKDPDEVLRDVTEVTRRAKTPAGEPWSGYDPAKVREALEKYAGTLTPAEADHMTESIYRAREEGSRPHDRP